MTASEITEESTYAKPPDNSYQAVLQDIVKLGWQQTQQGPYAGKWSYKIRFIYELNLAMEDGRPYTTSARYSYSMFGNSILRRDVEQMISRKFRTDAEAEGFDLEELIGRNFYITLVTDGRYQNVVSSIPWPMQMGDPIGIWNPVRRCQEPDWKEPDPIRPDRRPGANQEQYQQPQQHRQPQQGYGQQNGYAPQNGNGYAPQQPQRQASPQQRPPVQQSLPGSPPPQHPTNGTGYPTNGYAQGAPVQAAPRPAPAPVPAPRAPQASPGLMSQIANQVGLSWRLSPPLNGAQIRHILRETGMEAEPSPQNIDECVSRIDSHFRAGHPVPDVHQSPQPPVDRPYPGQENLRQDPRPAYAASVAQTASVGEFDDSDPFADE